MTNDSKFVPFRQFDKIQVQVSLRRRKTTPFDVVDERTTTKLLRRSCALTYTLRPVVVHPVVVVAA